MQGRLDVIEDKLWFMTAYVGRSIAPAKRGRSRLEDLRCHTCDVNVDERDEVLVRRTLSGDAGAFETLVRRYRRAALARAFGVLSDMAEAEDVAQDAFVQAYEHLAFCNSPARFAGWLMTIVHRRALNQARTIRRRRLVSIDDVTPEDTRAAITQTVDRDDTRRQLLAALDRLSVVQRSVVVLADLEQWSHQQIAESLNISVAMSRRHLSDARKLLRTS